MASVPARRNAWDEPDAAPLRGRPAVVDQARSPQAPAAAEVVLDPEFENEVGRLPPAPGRVATGGDDAGDAKRNCWRERP